MSHRVWINVCVGLQLITLLATLLFAAFTYINRWTYFRRVLDAQQNGDDAYEAARLSADYLAFEFLWLIVTCAIVIGLLAVVIAFNNFVASKAGNS